MKENLIYEESVLIKLYHNKSLQEEYLIDLLPGVFDYWRVLAFIMIQLHKKEVRITIKNILVMQKHKIVVDYAIRHNTLPYDNKQLEELLTERYTDTSTSLFKEAYDTIHDEAFFKFVVTANEEFTYEVAYKSKQPILNRAKAIIKLHNILFDRKVKQRKDRLREAINSINQQQSFVPTFSAKLNNIIGGFSKGFVASVIARPSHGKTTFMSWSALDMLYKDIDGKKRVDIISAEEPSDVFWRRIISTFFKIPSSMLRDGSYTITDRQYEELLAFTKDRLFFHSATSLEDILGITNTIRNSDFIWYDHVNAIAYPYGDEVKGIKSLVNGQKEYLANNTSTVMINLSQVNTKSMKFKGRLFPTKEDAFGSSVLEQASREFLSLYYPYLDSIDPELSVNLKKNKYEAPKNKLMVSIEKTSFGGKGLVELKFEHEIGRYKDTKGQQKNTNVILPEGEFELFS